MVQKIIRMPIEEMYASMALHKGSDAGHRMRHIADSVEAYGHRLDQRDCVPDLRQRVTEWLSLAIDADEHEGVRVAALHQGVAPMLALLANAIKNHKHDLESPLADNFAKRAEACLEKLSEVLPPAQETMDALLSIGEGAGQASASVRLASYATYMMARTQFGRMAGYQENEEQTARATKLAGEFPHAQTMHARQMALIG